MKKPTLRIFFLCMFASCTLYTHACAYAQVSTSASAHEVTAADYCDFLNDVGSSDVIPAQAGIQNNINPNFLYDEKMEADPEASCIVRLGTPGKFHYEVIARRENFPIAFVSSCNEKIYSDCLQERLQATGYRKR